VSQRAAPRLRIHELRSLPYLLGYLSDAKRTFTGGPKRSKLHCQFILCLSASDGIISHSSNWQVSKMKHAKLGFAQYRTPMLAVMITLGTLMLAQPSHAAVCANGVYRAGCVGPNGAVGVRKAYPHHYGYGYHGSVNCAHGPYRAGCAGPHGAAVVRRPY
jgi:hypothetical protein